MVNEFKIIILLEKVWEYAEKRNDFGRGRRENEFERKRELTNIVKIDLICLYL